MGRCVIDRPMNEVISFLENHERRKEWDRYLSVQLRQSMHDYHVWFCTHTPSLSYLRRLRYWKQFQVLISSVNWHRWVANIHVFIYLLTDYMVLEAKQCLVKLKRDMVIFAHNTNIVSWFVKLIPELILFYNYKIFCIMHNDAREINMFVQPCL